MAYSDGSSHAPLSVFCRLEGKVELREQSSAAESHVGRICVAPCLAGGIDHCEGLVLKSPAAAFSH